MKRVCGRIRKPPLWDEIERLREVIGVVMDRVDRNAHVDAGGDMMTINVHTTREHFSWESTSDRGCHTHGLVNAGAQK